MDRDEGGRDGPALVRDTMIGGGDALMRDGGTTFIKPAPRNEDVPGG